MANPNLKGVHEVEIAARANESKEEKEEQEEPIREPLKKVQAPKVVTK